MDVLDGGIGFDVAGFADKVVPVVVTLAGAIDAVVPAITW